MGGGGKGGGGGVWPRKYRGTRWEWQKMARNDYVSNYQSEVPAEGKRVISRRLKQPLVLRSLLKPCAWACLCMY